VAFSSANMRLYAFLIELHLECLHAEYLIKRMRQGARHGRQLAKRRGFGRKVTPRDIEMWAHACLGTFNRIRQILRPGKRKPVVQLRCQVLNRIIGPVSIDRICSPAVRHAWEHLDEQLDRLFENRKFRSYSHFSTTPGPKRTDHLDFRRFDPETLTLSFSDESISLKECLDEIRELNRAVVMAHDFMSDGRIVPWVAS